MKRGGVAAGAAGECAPAALAGRFWAGPSTSLVRHRDMTPWSLRKFRVFVFYACRTANEASWGRWSPVPPDWFGTAALSLLQALLVLDTVSVAAIAVGQGISQRPLLLAFAGVFVVLCIYNYATLVVRGQWHRFKRQFDNFTVDDLAFSAIGIVLCIGICLAILTYCLDRPGT